MADSKLSALTELSDVNIVPSSDLLYTDDISVTTSKKITVASARSALATEQASTSGTAINFTSLPAGLSHIIVMFIGVSTSGTSNMLIQLGDATTAGYLTSGYLGTAVNMLDVTLPSVTSYTTGLGINTANAANVHLGSIDFWLEDATDFTWVGKASLSLSNNSNVIISNTTIALAGVLDRLRITTVNGTDTFDAGAINIRYS